MPDSLTQDARLIAVETPLGKDYFMMLSVSRRLPL